MGFQEQLQVIIKRLPDTRQTLLFSATLPKLLVEFARAGLHDPTLVRLNVDSKLSEHLQVGVMYNIGVFCDTKFTFFKLLHCWNFM